METWKQSSRSGQTIALIACSKTKLLNNAPAGKMYQGALFKKSLAYCKARAYIVYILSAKYGLIEEGLIISPYNKTLNNMSDKEQREWSSVVSDKLKNLDFEKLVILAGNNYYKYLQLDGFDVEFPLKSLPFGKRLQWLNNKLSGGSYKMKRFYNNREG